MASEIVMIGDEPIKVEFGTQSQMDVEQTLFIMSQGLSKRTFLDIINNINDTREITTLIMQGVNGANRVEGIDKRISFVEAAELYEKHRKMVGQQSKSIEDVTKYDERLKNDIRNAGLKGMYLDFLMRPTV